MRKEVRDCSPCQRRLRVEQLEDRRLLAVLTVQNDLDNTLANLADDGELSLREAIEIANNPGTVIDGFVSNDVEDTIEFASPFFDEARTILLADGELEITETLTIDGPGQELLAIDAGGGTNGVIGDGDGFRVFNIDDGDPDIDHDVILRGLTLTGGDVFDGSISAAAFGKNGGAIFSLENLTILDSTIFGNAAGGQGGGVYLASAELTLVGTKVLNNISDMPEGIVPSEPDGGGVFASEATVSITDSTFANNTAEERAGALRVVSSTVSIERSIFDGNESLKDWGGAIHNTVSVLNIKDSLFTNNRATNSSGGPQGLGGALLTEGNSGVSTITNSTFSKNRAYAGGAIADFASGHTIIRHSTIAENSAESRGGGILTTLDYIMEIEHTLVVANHLSLGSGSLIPNDTWGRTIANWSFFNQVVSGSGGGTNIVSRRNPRLGPLADNGGATLTYALLFGSPAIDAGDPAIIFDPNQFDQRGAMFHRVSPGINLGMPQQIIDIGAFEVQFPHSADFVDDDHINGQDFLAWQRGFGETENVSHADGDSDGDGDVDFSDLDTWQVTYGQTESPPPPLAAFGVSGQKSVRSEDLSANLIDSVLGIEFGSDEEQTTIVSDQGFAEAVRPFSNHEPAQSVVHQPSTAEPRQEAEATDEEQHAWLADQLLERVFG